MPTQSKQPIGLFISYAHEDEALLLSLHKHLRPLQDDRTISTWHDREIVAGADFAKEIDKHLNSAQIILLLVSVDFLNSDYCIGVEVQRAMKRHELGEAIVVPVILRPCEWQGKPFGRLKALPKDAKPVTSWPNDPDHDAAFTDIAQGVRKAVNRLTVIDSGNVKPPKPPQERVFKVDTPKRSNGSFSPTIKESIKPRTWLLLLGSIAALFILLIAIYLYLNQSPDCRNVQVRGFELNPFPGRTIADGEAITIAPWDMRNLSDELRGRVVFTNPDAAKGCPCIWREERDNKSVSDLDGHSDCDFTLIGVKGKVGVIKLTLKAGNSTQPYSFTINLSPQ